MVDVEDDQTDLDDDEVAQLTTLMDQEKDDQGLTISIKVGQGLFDKATIFLFYALGFYAKYPY